MLVLRRRLTFASVASVLALFLAGGGGGYAVAARRRRRCSSLRRQRGALHLRQGPVCPRRERTLAWNQLGPRGADGRDGTNGSNGTDGAAGASGPPGLPGSPGPPGAPGSPGTSGPSDAFTDYGSQATIAGGSTRTVASVTLPVGHYTLSADIAFFEANQDGKDTLLDCQFVSFGALHQMTIGGAVGAIADAGSNLGQMMPLIGDVTITANNTNVFVRCTPEGTPRTPRTPRLWGP